MEYQVQSPTGEMHTIEGPEGASDADITKAAQDLFGQGKLESFARGTINNLPAGGQLGALGTAALKGTDYSQGMEEFNQKAAEAKAEHPVAYGAGAVTGSIAPLAIPGVGEAFAAAPIAAGAGLGALNAIGNTDIAQNPGEALKQGIEGAATGAVLGKILPSGEHAAETVENYANRKAVQTLNLKPGMLGIPQHELEDLGRFASEVDLTQGALEQRVNTAKDLLQQVGAQVGESGVGAVPLADPTPFIDQLHQHLQESAQIYGPESNLEATIYRQGIANLSKPNLTFDELQQLKTAYGQRAFDAVGDVKNDAAANVYNVYKDAMKSIISDSPTEYQDAMTTYGKLKDIHGALMTQFQKEQAQGLQAKGFGLAGKMGGMVTGGNIPATAGLAAAIAPAHPFMGMGLATTLITNPSAMESAARGISSALPSAATATKFSSIDSATSYLLNTLNTNPQRLGKFAKPLIQAAQQGGTQGLAAQHFLLSQQYPEYNSMVMESGHHLVHKGSEEVIHNAIQSQNAD